MQISGVLHRDFCKKLLGSKQRSQVLNQKGGKVNCPFGDGNEEAEPFREGHVAHVLLHMRLCHAEWGDVNVQGPFQVGAQVGQSCLDTFEQQWQLGSCNEVEG